MALVLKDRVKETTTTTGTGTLTLGGAVTGYQSFSSAIGNTNTTYYAIYLDGGSEWEVGIGTVSAGALSRDTILASSNSGSAVNFSAGQKTVWCDYPAGKAVYTDASGNISQTIGNISGITGAISTVDTVTFDTAYATALTAGQIGWNGNDTLGLGMIGGNVIQHIGEDQFFYAKATATITKGQVVMFTGAVGASGVPTGAPATGISDGNYIMGVAAENIANNGFGLVQSFGTLRKVNTTGYADGDILWYDPTVTGGLTKTKPVAPNVKVQMAAVINGGSSGGGTILIRINAGSTLGGSDSNAEIGTPSNGQIITYDGQDGYWKNTDLGAGTGISVSESTTGVLTVTNTAPDQTVSLTGAGTTSISGTYPNFTITSNDEFDGTVTSVAATAGTGISVTGSPITSSGTLTITNTAPDQTVVLTAGTGISTSGTYPSFTVTNTAPDQTVSLTAGTGISVTGTYPSFTVTNTSTATGDVVGPASSTDNAIARYDGTTGKLIQNSAVTINDTGGTITTSATTTTLSTSTTNGQFTFDLRPNGTADGSFLRMLPFSSINNSPYLWAQVNSSRIRFESAINGTASYLPIEFRVSNGDALTLNTNGTVQTYGNVIFGGALDEKVFAVSGTTPALSPSNGTIQTWTLSANSTPTAGTWNDGESLTLMVLDGTAYTITWTSVAVTWVGGTAPTLDTTKQNVIELWKVGGVIYGALVGAA